MGIMVTVEAYIHLFTAIQVLKYTPQVVFESRHLIRTEALVEELRHLL